MGLDLSKKSQLLSEKVNVEQQFILEVEGFPVIYGAQEVTKLAKYGEDDIKYGDVGLVYGGVVADPRSRDYISLEGTTNNLTQHI